MRRPTAPRVKGRLASSVVASIISEVRNGSIRSGEKLPSEREYAVRLNVSRNTVTAAYEELEHQGAIRRIHGKGSFLCALPGSDENFSWHGKVSRLANTLDQPVLELLTRRCSDPATLPLSAGTPSLEVFPTAVYQAYAAQILDKQLNSVVAIAPTEGQWALRQSIARWTRSEPRHIMITSGAQEAIDIVARCLIEPGDHVVIDSPTYPGAIQSFQSAGAKLLPWGTEWSLAELEELFLRYKPKAVFTNPTFHNPTGRVMSLQQRRDLLDLAYRYRVPILEDNIYARTSFGSEPVPDSLYDLDSRSQVIAMNTFSKILAPGLRIGWVAAPSHMIKQLTLIKMRSNLFTCALNQLILAALLDSGEMEEHLLRLRLHHGNLCAAGVKALKPACDEGLIRYRPPTGGLYLWCRLPSVTDHDLLLSELEAEGVSASPGVAFDPGIGDEWSSYIRICFSAVPKEGLVNALDILTSVLRRDAARNANDTEIPAASASAPRMQRSGMGVQPPPPVLQRRRA